MKKTIAVLAGAVVLWVLYVSLSWKQATEPTGPAAQRTVNGSAPATQTDPWQPAGASNAPAVAETGVAACDQYLERVAACDKLPVRTRTAFLSSFAGWHAARDKAMRRGTPLQWAEATGKKCGRVAQAWDTSLRVLGC